MSERTTVAQWRRRCLAAEDRADTEARAARRWKATAKRQSGELAELREAFDYLQRYAHACDCVIERLAKQHLGEGASKEELERLVELWFREHQRRSRKSRVAVVHITPSELLRRLGFDIEGDDDE